MGLDQRLSPKQVSASKKKKKMQVKSSLTESRCVAHKEAEQQSLDGEKAPWSSPEGVGAVFTKC